jgi:TonB-linked SusC/RagA family outer membrane protein
MKNFCLILLLLIFTVQLKAETLQVQGIVTSQEDGLPLPGVTVIVKGSSAGTSTDIDGKFSIQASSNSTLVFSYIGTKTLEKKVAGSSMNVVMQPNATMLDEVVAIGYGTMKKSDLTGSVTTVSADQLKKTPASGLDQALQGRAAGVTVNLNSGQPGASAQVRIRGIGTVNDANPIYVVDGIIVSDISFLNPNDIETTEVLKDASATAIYGSRGANGVILVTTKKGSQKGHSEISYDGYIGWQNRWKKLNLMKRDQFVNTMLSMDGITESERKYFNTNGFNAWLSTYRLGSDKHFPTVLSEKYPNGLDYSSIDTDWQDEVFNSNAIIQNHHVSIDGGTDNATYSFSGSYFDQDGTIKGSNYKRYTIRANTSFQVKNWMKIGENITYAYSTGRNAMNNNSSPGASILSAALAMAPWDPVRYPAGSVNKKGTDLSNQISASSNFKNVVNPYSMVENNNPSSKIERWVGDVYMEITHIKHLTFRSDVSADITTTRDRNYTPKYELSTYDKSENNFLSTSMNRYSTVIWNNVLTYARTIKDHDFSIMVGQTGEEYDMYGLSGSGKNITNADDSNHWYLSQTESSSRNSGDAVSRSRRLSFLGRAHYSFMNKYLVTFNFRADGTNKFPENTWGYFPSMALGWKMSEESWMKNVNHLDYLKLRFGWGRIGNDKIGNDSFNQTIFTTGPTFVDYVFGSTQSLADGATVLTYINQGGKWELTETWNAGIDYSFYKGMLNGSVEFFLRDTKDMLLTVKGPAYIGNRYDAQKNVGTVRNKGIEITIGHNNHIGNFNYSINGNVSFIDNKLTALNGGEKQYGAYTLNDEGYALYTFYGYKYQGVYQTDAEAKAAMWGYTDAAQPYHAGDAKYQDLNGDGCIDDKDKTDIGNPFPWMTYGLNLGAEWKGFDLSVFFQGQVGNKIYNQVRVRTEGRGVEATLSDKMTDVWTSNNITGSIPNPYGNSDNYAASSRFVESGSYLRLKNLQVGYTLPKVLTTRVGIDRCRFYVSANNLLTCTKYTGYDPEVGGGVDYGNYPQSRTIMMGVNLNF